jgi:hypothetical protein
MSSKVVSKKVVNMSLRQKNTQLINPEEFDGSRVVFDDPVAESIPGQPGTNYRINLGYKNADNTEGFLILGFDTCYCFGVSENVDLNSKALNGYNVAISLYDINGATPRQQKTVEALQDIIQQCKKNILKDSTQEAMGKIDDDDKILESDLRKINLIFWKKENGKPNPEMGGTIYPKMIWSKARTDAKTNKQIPSKMMTRFYSEDDIDADGNPVEVNPLDYVGKRFQITPAIKIESIFIGAKISIQAKVYEAFVKETESGPKRLLVYRPQRSEDIIVVNTPVQQEKKTSFEELENDDNDNEEEENSEVQQEPEPTPVVVTKPVEKTTKRTRK